VNTAASRQAAAGLSWTAVSPAAAASLVWRSTHQPQPLIWLARSADAAAWHLLSFFVDVEAALGRLAALGLGGPPRRVTQPTPRGPVTLATVCDPDGLLVLLTPGSITRSV